MMYMSSRQDLPPSTYPGQRLGLPETGIKSVARLGRRAIALLVDWNIALVLTLLISGTDYFAVASSSLGQMATLGIFVALQILAMWTIGGSIGHRIMGLYLVAVSGERLAPWRPVVRSVLLALVIPALVWDSDQRGFHDKIAGTILLKSR